MTRSPRAIEALCLDWAGTTIDFGCQAPVAVFRAAFERAGLPVSDAEVRAPMGMGKWDHIRAMLEQPALRKRWESRFGSAPDEGDVDRLYEHFLPLQKETVARHVTLIPGVLDALSTLRNGGIRIGATTGYPREVMRVVEPLAVQAGYTPEISVAIDDVKQGRPAPDQLLRALEALGGIAPDRAVAIDDTVTGVQAGRNAGMWTVGVVASGNLIGLTLEEWEGLAVADREALLAPARTRLLEAGAHEVIDTVADILPVVEHFDERWASGGRP